MKTLELIGFIVSIVFFVLFLAYGFLPLALGALTGFIVSVDAHNRAEAARIRKVIKG